MSTNFLTIAQAAAKLGYTISGTQTNFVTKAQCLAAGAAATSLTGYADAGFPIDDHIVKGIITYTLYIKRTTGLYDYYCLAYSPYGIPPNYYPTISWTLSGGNYGVNWTSTQGLAVNDQYGSAVYVQPGTPVAILMRNPSNGYWQTIGGFTLSAATQTINV